MPPAELPAPSPWQCVSLEASSEPLSPSPEQKRLLRAGPEEGGSEGGRRERGGREGGGGKEERKIEAGREQGGRR